MATQVTEVEDLTDVSRFDEDQAAIWWAQKEMYLGYLTGDRDRIDRHILDHATIWDAVTLEIARGKADLNRIRATRPSGDEKPTVTRFTTEDAIIDASDGLGISRHILRVESSSPQGDTAQIMRVTNGWRKLDGDWFIVHAHEDLFTAGE